MSSENHAGPLSSRQLLQRINVDAGKSDRTAAIISNDSEQDRGDDGSLAPIVVQASAEGLPLATISIPLTVDVRMLPLAAAAATSELAAADASF